MLGELAHGFDVSIPSAGLLLFVGGVVVALGAPLAATRVLSIADGYWAASMLVYVACHAASALAPNFAVLLAIRLLLAIPAAIFTPQAAVTVGALFPTESRAGAITLSSSAGRWRPSAACRSAAMSRTLGSHS
jgi:DHA1 family inner membrane transport protein